VAAIPASNRRAHLTAGNLCLAVDASGVFIGVTGRKRTGEIHYIIPPMYGMEMVGRGRVRLAFYPPLLAASFL